MLNQLLKPWFVYRPAQLARRGVTLIRPARPGYQELSTSWGGRVLVDPTREVGISIRTTGVYDLVVSETLARLTNPGDTVVDAGANVGYMSSLLSALVGPTGTLIAFEPHPALFGILKRTLAGRSHAELHNAALGESDGMAQLVMPLAFDSNDGLSYIAPDSEPGAAGHTGVTASPRADASTATRVDVELRALDDVLGSRAAAVMKLDVEGYELHVLRGASRAVAERRIRHIVFEDHAVAESAVVAHLRGAGYALFALGWTLRGPRIEPLPSDASTTLPANPASSLARSYEAPSYLATLASDEAHARMTARGWMVLRRPLRPSRVA
jgi:FkbM family methyltransferase